MPYQENNDRKLTRDNILEMLKQVVPNIHSMLDPKLFIDPLDYVIFGDLALWLLSMLNDGNTSDTDVNDLFSLLNQMAESADPEVVNILQIGFFEVLKDGDPDLNILNQKLNTASLIIYRQS